MTSKEKRLGEKNGKTGCLPRCLVHVVDYLVSVGR